MTSPPVHRPLDPPVPVRFTIKGETWTGLAVGWIGERVNVTYSSGVGLNHLAWVPAEDLERI